MKRLLIGLILCLCVVAGCSEKKLVVIGTVTSVEFKLQKGWIFDSGWTVVTLDDGSCWWFDGLLNGLRIGECYRFYQKIDWTGTSLSSRAELCVKPPT